MQAMTGWADMAGYTQLAVVGASLLLAWLLNLYLHRRLMQRTPQAWQLGVGGIKRVLFPLGSLAFVQLGAVLLRHWQMPTGWLALATTLLLAMAGVRLAVYTLRYIFAPSAWLKTTENAIAAVIWLVLALHLLGVLPQFAQTLDGMSFSIGQTRISVLLVLQAMVTVALTLVAALWVSRLLENRLMRAEKLEMNLRVVGSKLVRILLTLVGVLAALSAVGFDITLLSVFGGALGVGLGFGLQKIASNYVSGFILLLDDSLHIGDVITVGQDYGVVSQIQSRYLVLKKLDGTEVVIPNETLIATSYINHTYSERKTRVLLTVQISYDSPLEEAMALMCQAAAAQPRVLGDPPPDAAVLGFGENGINLRLSVWISDPEGGSTILKSAIYLEMWRLFRQHGISIPFPQREVRVLGAAPGPLRPPQ